MKKNSLYTTLAINKTFSTSTKLLTNSEENIESTIQTKLSRSAKTLVDKDNNSPFCVSLLKSLFYKTKIKSQDNVKSEAQKIEHELAELSNEKKILKRDIGTTRRAIDEIQKMKDENLLPNEENFSNYNKLKDTYKAFFESDSDYESESSYMSESESLNVSENNSEAIYNSSSDSEASDSSNDNYKNENGKLNKLLEGFNNLKSYLIEEHQINSKNWKKLRWEYDSTVVRSAKSGWDDFKKRKQDQIESEDENPSKKSRTPTSDFIDNLPQDYNPMDDIVD